MLLCRGFLPPIIGLTCQSALVSVVTVLSSMTLSLAGLLSAEACFLASTPSFACASLVTVSTIQLILSNALCDLTCSICQVRLQVWFAAFDFLTRAGSFQSSIARELDTVLIYFVEVETVSSALLC